MVGSSLTDVTWIRSPWLAMGSSLQQARRTANKQIAYSTARNRHRKTSLLTKKHEKIKPN